MEINTHKLNVKCINKQNLQYTKTDSPMKKELKKLHNYLVAIKNYWDRPHYVTLSVLVNNMMMTGNGEVREDALMCIEAMHKLHPDDHVIEHTLDELYSYKTIQLMEQEREAMFGY